MKRILLLLVILNISLFAYTSVKNLKFESGISIYGQVGFVDIKLEENHDKQTYKMKAIAYSTGILKVLTRNRKEIFISEGDIKDGVYLPKKFTREVIKTDYKRVTVYKFDYKNNKVIKTKTLNKIKHISKFDIVNLKYINSKKHIHETQTQEIKLYKNDFLSLYLNMQKGNLKKGKVNYVDMKPKDSLLLVADDKIEVQKNNGKDRYNIDVYYDKNSIFFDKVVSVGIGYYGDAYIKKIDEKTKVID
jgi:hypothetical protein